LEGKKLVKKRKGKTGTIETHELFQWFGLTIVYLIFIMVLGGIIGKNLEDLYYIGTLALDLQEAFWVLATLMWTMISVWLGFKYKLD
jgi:hypothetical protein